MSPELLAKWRKLMEEQYGVKEPAPQEVLDFALRITAYFETLSKSAMRTNEYGNRTSENK